MGFYGNITNTSNTTFSFDRIYSNKREMDSNVNNDGIFIGRYVLVEYDQDAAYPVVFMNKQTNKFYSSKNFDQATEIRYISGDKSDEYILTTDTSVVSGKQYYKLENDKYIDVSLNSNDNPRALGLYEYVSTSDGVYKDEIVQVQEVTSDEKTGNLITIFIGFYQCEGTYDGEHAQFKQLDKDPNAAKSNYIKNFAIDEKHLNGEQQKSFKGYDSTVWMKSSVTASDGKLITKYVNIADLNSVVPTFDIAADAPTMSPITPHFDADSTNVYYKLHIQPQWGMRVAAANGSNSDVETYWTRENYNPSTGLSTKQYWNKNSGNWVNYDNEEEIQTFDAAIYYNRAGFEEYTRKHVDASLEDNIINIEPTGESGNLYSNHNKDNNNSTAKDIQEIRINLPAIGNMMSDAWDIIHGKQRNDYRGDGENSSLQGRLDAFQDICANQIAVKSSDEDGTIVGSKINNGEKYVHEGDILDKRLNVEDNGLLNNDDPWIRTYINTANLVHSTYQDDSGLSQEDNNGIAIQHTFHATADSETSLDKNNGEAQVSERQEKYIHAIKDSGGNIIKTPINAEMGNKTDEIKLYTPYVDATGHIVGKNIETVTLPYGYKTIRAATQSTAVTDPSTNTTEVIADSTQDILQFASSNKWIKMSGTNKGKNINYDTFNIGHEVHDIPNSDNKDTDLNDSKKYYSKTDGNTIDIPDWEYDEAGHIKNKHNRKYILPYGYKKIAAENSDAVSAAPVNTTVEPTADNTQDTLNLTASNKWIKFNTSDSNNNDEIQIGHILNKNTTDANKDFGLSSNMTVAQVDANNNQFNIPVIQFDEAGHISKAETHTVSLPNGFTTYTSTVSGTDDADSTEGKVGSFSPDTMTDIITLAEGNQWINIETSEDKFTFKHYAKDFNKKPELTYNFNNSDSTDGPNTFITTDWKKDRAGHLIEGQDTKYTLPNGIKTLSIQDTGKDTVDIVTGSGGQLTADNLVDTMTIDNGNRWIRLVANGKTVKLYHDAPSSTSSSSNTTNANNNNNKTLSFNSTFEVPQVKYDETGHIFGINKHTITLPSTSTLRLNNYSKGTSTAAITTNEAINNAFGKLENRLDLLQGDKDVVGSVDNKISIEVAKILDDADPSDIDTLNEIAGWIINDTTGAAKMANDISDLKTKMGSSSVATQITNKINALDKPDTVVEGQYVSAVSEANGIITVTRESLPTLSTGSINGTIKLGNDNEVAVKGLGSAAFTESTAYAKSDVLDTKFKYGATEEQKTIADLMNKVAELEIKLNELNNQINPPQELDEGGETI